MSRKEDGTGPQQSYDFEASDDDEARARSHKFLEINPSRIAISLSKSIPL